MLAPDTRSSSTCMCWQTDANCDSLLASYRELQPGTKTALCLDKVVSSLPDNWCCGTSAIQCQTDKAPVSWVGQLPHGTGCLSIEYHCIAPAEQGQKKCL